MKTISPDPQTGAGKANTTRDIEVALRSTRLITEAPADLRGDVMRQVLLESRRTSRPLPKQSFLAWRWAFAPAAAAAVLLALALNRDSDFANHGPEAASLHAASRVLTSENRLAGDFTAAIISPLHEELTRVDTDLKRVANHLLASVP
jgi:hypothetical protein